MNYMHIDKASISNGLGFRVVLWCSGCSIKCQGCHNSQTWDFNSGQLFGENAKQYLFEQLNKSYIKGVTFSGGHPIESKNIIAIYDLIQEIKEQFPSKDIWLYTGLTLSINDFISSTQDLVISTEVFKRCDVIVDGPYIEEQRDITLPFRGSSNQRIIDVKQTIQQNQIVLLNI